MKVSTISGDMAVKLALGVALLGAAFFAYSKLKGVSEKITGAARTDAYKEKGPIGTLAAATDIASGGTLSRVGEYLGGKAADWFLPDPMEQMEQQKKTTPADPYDFIFTRRGVVVSDDDGIKYDHFGNPTGY